MVARYRVSLFERRNWRERSSCKAFSLVVRSRSGSVCLESLNLSRSSDSSWRVLPLLLGKVFLVSDSRSGSCPWEMLAEENIGMQHRQRMRRWARELKYIVSVDCYSLF